VEKAIRGLPPDLFDDRDEVVFFGSMTKEDLEKLVGSDPSALVIALTRVCGLSDREFYRLYGLKEVYVLRESWVKDQERRDLFLEIIAKLLPEQMHLETFLYTFYKMWEEHQKRHHRARFEEDVRVYFRAHGYECRKISRPLEVNGAIPPSKPEVVIQVRTGVRKDLVKRAKEFSSEFDKAHAAFPRAKFLIVFKIPTHELDRREEIRHVIESQRTRKRQYDAILFQDELENAIAKLRQWNVQKAGPVGVWSPGHRKPE